MLTSLQIKDFLLIEHIQLSFQEGFSVITGESGTGKSTIMRSLLFLFGERANTGLIRHGANETSVTAFFQIPEDKAENIVQILPTTIPTEDFSSRYIPNKHGKLNLQIIRTLTHSGRNKNIINGKQVSAKIMKLVGEQCIELYQQNTQQSLIQKSTQLNILDTFANHEEQCQEIRTHFESIQKLMQHKRQLQNNLASKDQKQLLQYQITELEELIASESTYDVLNERYNQLAKANDTINTLNQLHAILENNEDAIKPQINRLNALIKSINYKSDGIENVKTIIEQIDIQISECIGDVVLTAASIPVDEQLLHITSEKLAQYHQMARKYQVEPNQLNALLLSLQEQAKTFDERTQSLDKLQIEIRQKKQAFTTKASKLSANRKLAAQTLESSITQWMQKLGIRAGSCKIVFREIEASSKGTDALHFHIKTHPNQPYAPLEQVASGGELSRIFLAIQAINIQKNTKSSLLLDEADAGIGGSTAQNVGQILALLAKNVQTICITHSPQIASQGQHHYQIIKDAQHQVQALELSYEERTNAIASMLSGESITSTTKANAREMLNLQ